MATSAKGAANVVRLPTAAKRKVDNWRFAEQRRAVLAFRKAEPWPGKVIKPIDQATECFKRENPDSYCSSELLIALAILRTVPPEQRRQAQDIVHRAYFEIGGEAARAASALVAMIK